jgi:ABC-2 type transport system permease protein
MPLWIPQPKRRLQFTPVSIAGVLSMVLLGAAVFATFSLIVACLVKTRERFIGIGQVLTMPLFFASNAIYPLEIMAGWLKVVSKLNPLSYLVDVLRTLMVQGGHSAFGVLVDVGVELGALILLRCRGGAALPLGPGVIARPAIS